MLLEKIQTPADVKRLTGEELELLAGEIRKRLIQVTAKNGGHLAPNLGAVELTLALHRVYNAPQDKIIWDVGHQAYVHKLLTGRNDEFFDTLRSYKGMSGFPKRQESSYDVFGTGHSSTSISAAVGFALARDLKREKHKVVAVIGDGAMTGGMVYEGLNHAGHLGLDMTVILNDNEMSIDPNVGGLSDYLNRLRSDPNYQRAKEDVESILTRIPTFGKHVVGMADRLKDTMKHMLVPGGYFEELGFKYFGPINGHDIEALIQILENTKDINRPVIIHCLTKKGKGYWAAEARPDRFHGTGAFNIRTGEATKKSGQKSYTDVFADTLITLGKRDKRICAITAAMASGTGVVKFKEVFPNRAFDVGIAEEHATTMAAGLALAGERPILAVYSTFMQRAFDQIIHDCALQNAPVVFAMDRAGLVGEDGPTHHGVFDLSYLRMIPNMIAMAPKNERELQNMLYSAIQYDMPTAIRYPRGNGPGSEISEEFQYIEQGKGEWLKHGRDITLVAIGSMVETAIEAADSLRAEGVDCGVINARFVKPLDGEILAEAFAESKLIVTLEENVLAGGFGAAVMEWASEQGKYGHIIQRIGIPDKFIEAGAVTLLKKDIKLDTAGVVEQIKNWYKGE